QAPDFVEAECFQTPREVAAYTLPAPSKRSLPMNVLSSSLPPTRSVLANTPAFGLARRYTPEPTNAVAPVLASPVASHSAPSGARRMSPTERVGRPSVSGAHVAPPSCDRKTPPAAPPM